MACANIRINPNFPIKNIGPYLAINLSSKLGKGTIIRLFFPNN